jgi:hypothetical protein
MAFGGFLKESTAVDVLIGPFVDEDDGKTAETGLTLDVELSKNGQALADKNDSTTPVHDAAGTVDGYYNCELDATDTNTIGNLTVVAHPSGTALPVRLDFQVVEGTNYDDLFGSSSIVDKIWDEIIRGSTHNTRHSAAWHLVRAKGGGGDSPSEVTVHTGTAQAGGTNTITLDTGALAVDNIYRGSLINITGGTGVGQTNTIYAYVGSTKVATMAKDWITVPDATSTFSVIASSTAINSDEGVAQAGSASTITLQSTASSDNDIYNNALVSIISGTGSGQTRVISDSPGYNGSTKVATVTAVWGTNPDSTSVYAVIPDQQVSGDVSATGPSAEEIRIEMDDNSADLDSILAGDAMATTKTWTAAVELAVTTEFGGAVSPLAADRAYDYTSDVDLETNGYNGAHILVETKLNFGASRSLGAPTTPNGIIVEVFASLDGTTYDTIPYVSKTVEGRGDGDFRRFSMIVKDVAHFRIGLRTTGTEDTYDYRITHQTWI